MKITRPIQLLCAIVLCSAAHAAPTPAPTPPKYGGEYKGTFLYTNPDPNAQGGIHFLVKEPVLGAYAIPEKEQTLVYKGVLNKDGTDVSFTQLPIAKYDLVLLFKSHIFEGVVLNRDENNLTDQDLQFISGIIMRSIPFFDLKKIHRIKGTTGTAGKAACVLQEVRTGKTGWILNQNGDIMKDHQIRSIKLAFIEDVGKVGWQLATTRELIRTDVFPGEPKDLLGIDYLESLGGIRVTDSVKDLGTLSLERSSLDTLSRNQP